MHADPQHTRQEGRQGGGHKGARLHLRLRLPLPKRRDPSAAATDQATGRTAKCCQGRTRQDADRHSQGKLLPLFMLYNVLPASIGVGQPCCQGGENLKLTAGCRATGQSCPLFLFTKRGLLLSNYLQRTWDSCFQMGLGEWDSSRFEEAERQGGA